MHKNSMHKNTSSMDAHNTWSSLVIYIEENGQHVVGGQWNEFPEKDMQSHNCKRWMNLHIKENTPKVLLK